MNASDIYMAGLIDGEGSITLSRRRASQMRTPVVSVSSTTYELLEWLPYTYGGSISHHKTYHENHKHSWSWKVCKRSDTTALLTSILPYMREPRKIARAQFVLDNYDLVTKRNGKYTPEQLAAKISFEEEFFRL